MTADDSPTLRLLRHLAARMIDPETLTGLRAWRAAA